MSMNIIMAFASKNWDMDTGYRAELRTIFNQYIGFPERNHNPFGSNLVFDENANKITRWMSEHVLRSFASK